jgi:hypothetical protein
VVIASAQGHATISSPILSVRHAAEAWAGLGWVGELGRCHKNKPQAVYSCLGFGGVVATRLLTGQQGASGDGGCYPVGQCAFDEDFLSENNYTLVCGDLYVYLRLASSRLIGRSQCTRGRECRERPRETLLVALLGEPR